MIRNTETLRAIQLPLKERYRTDPDAAQITLKAEGRIGQGLTCCVDTGKALVEAGNDVRTVPTSMGHDVQHHIHADRIAGR